MQKNLKINLTQNSYQVFIGDKAIDLFINKINNTGITNCLVIVDSNVVKHHNILIRKILSLIYCNTHFLKFNATEKNKSLRSVEIIYQFLSSKNFDRDSAVVAIGGGITGDIAGYAASTFMRGIKFFQIPTTLLSMVDSSVGGKTGVNYLDRKNQIGSFYQPEDVFIYPEFLKTLSKREISSGAGEVFKYSFLADQDNYKLVKNNLSKLSGNKDLNFVELIFSCLLIKSGIVRNDEKEKTGLRKILNLGHTFAHAFESESGFRLKHGEAVIAGIFCALFVSQKSGYLSPGEFNKILNDFSFIKAGRYIKNMNADNVYKKMLYDKKTSKDNIRLVLIEAIGSIVVDVVVEKPVIVEAIEWIKKNI